MAGFSNRMEVGKRWCTVDEVDLAQIDVQQEAKARTNFSIIDGSL